MEEQAKTNSENTTKKLKVLIVGSRYTGKGQIGRAWANTDADLPTLQPVLLYEKDISIEDKDYKVVLWILSFDDEFKSLRNAFYKTPDAIIYTFDASDESGKSLEELDKYREEIIKEINSIPISILIGVNLKEDTPDYPYVEAVKERARKWAEEKGVSRVYFIDYKKTDEFKKEVDEIIRELVRKMY